MFAVVAIFAAALGSGLMAGLYFVFSIAVMPALGRLPTSAGVTAMQTINKVIVNPWFLAVFFGTGLICLALIGAAATGSVGGHGTFVTIACLLYLAGNIGVTMLFNVPLNNQLAAAEPTSADAARVWGDYLIVWTHWNHVRVVSCLTSAALLIAPYMLRDQ